MHSEHTLLSVSLTHQEVIAIQAALQDQGNKKLRCLALDKALSDVTLLFLPSKPRKTDNKTDVYALNISLDMAKTLNKRLFTHQGFLMGLQEDDTDSAMGQAHKKLMKALIRTFGREHFVGLLDTVSLEHQPLIFENASEAHLCVATDVDGDIAAYSVFTGATFKALNASHLSCWDFINSSDPQAPKRFDTLKEALAYMKTNNLTLVEDFGVTAS